MAGPLLLGIPLWAWITGGGIGAAVGGTYVAGNTAEQIGDASVQVGDAMTKVVLVTGGAFLAYQAVKVLTK